jgi:hypothetical protein
VDAAVEWITKLPERAAYGLGYLAGTIVKAFLFLNVKLPQLIGQLTGVILGKLGQLIGDALGKAGELRDRLVSRFNDLKTAAIQRFVELAMAIPQRLNDLKVAALLKAAELVQAIPQKLNELKNLVIAVFLFLVTVVPNKLGELRAAAVQKAIDLKNAIVTEIQKLPGQALQVAKDFIMGLVNGIINGVGWVIDALKNLAGDMLAGFRHALDQHSPSRKMHQEGLYVAQGLANGLLAGARLVQGAWQQVMAPLMGGVNGPQVGQPALATVGTTIGQQVGNSVAGARPLVAMGGGNVTITHNWAGAFPNAKSADEIEAAIRKVQRDDYRKGRIPGGMQGLRS